MASVYCYWNDGYVARKYSCVSEFGKIFDPHHDKIQYHCKSASLVLDALVMAIVFHNYHYVIVAIILKYITGERDETVGFHRLWASTISNKLKLSARSSGKWRTRICFTGFPLLHLIMSPIHSLVLFYIIAGIMALITSWSLYDYVSGYRKDIKNFLKK